MSIFNFTVLTSHCILTVMWQLQLSVVRLQHAGDFNAVNYSRPLMAASSPEVVMMIGVRMVGRGQADWLEDTAQCSLSWSARLQLLASTAEGLEFGWWSSEPWAESTERTEQRALESRTVTWRDTVTPLARCDAELAGCCVAWARCVTVRPGLLCHESWHWPEETPDTA